MRVSCNDRLEHASSFLPRTRTGDRGNLPGKEVFHPQVLLRIPCYDLVPISSFTVVPPIAGKGPSGASTFHDLTGGEYKTQELIHRSIADLRLLAIPTSCRRVAADNPNWGRVSGICSTLRIRNPLSRTIVARV